MLAMGAQEMVAAMDDMTVAMASAVASVARVAKVTDTVPGMGMLGVFTANAMATMRYAPWYGTRCQVRV